MDYEEVDYTKLHWWSDFMASEMGYVDEDDVENDFVVGVYSPKNDTSILLYINVETEQIIDTFINEYEE